MHDASLVLKVAVGQEAAVKKTFGGSEVAEMIQCYITGAKARRRKGGTIRGRRARE